MTDPLVLPASPGPSWSRPSTRDLVVVLADPLDEHPRVEQLLEIAVLQVGLEEEPVEVRADIFADQVGDLGAPVDVARRRWRSG